MRKMFCAVVAIALGALVSSGQTQSLTAITNVYTGTGPNTGTGDQAILAFNKINTNTTILSNSMALAAAQLQSEETNAVHFSQLQAMNITNLGVFPNGRIIDDCRMTAGSATVTLGNTYDSSFFLPSDVGDAIMINFAGWAKPVPYAPVPTTNFLALVGHIKTYISPTQVILDTNAIHSIGPWNGGAVDQFNPEYVGYSGFVMTNSDDTAAINAMNAWALTNALSIQNAGINLFVPAGVYICTNPPTGAGNCFSQIVFPQINPQADEGVPVFHLYGPVVSSTHLPFGHLGANIGNSGAMFVSFWNPTNPIADPGWMNGYYTNISSFVSCQGAYPTAYGSGYFGMGKGSSIQANAFEISLENLTFVTPADRQYSCLDLRGAQSFHLKNINVWDGINQDALNYDNRGATNSQYIWPTCTNSFGLMLAPENNSGDSLMEGRENIFGFYNALYPGEHGTFINVLIECAFNGITPDFNGHPGTWVLMEVDQVMNGVYSLPGSVNNEIMCSQLQMENLASTNNPNNALGYVPAAINETNGFMTGMVTVKTDSAITNQLVQGDNLYLTMFSNGVPFMVTAPYFNGNVNINGQLIVGNSISTGSFLSFKTPGGSGVVNVGLAFPGGNLGQYGSQFGNTPPGSIAIGLNGTWGSTASAWFDVFGNTMSSNSWGVVSNAYSLNMATNGMFGNEYRTVPSNGIPVWVQYLSGNVTVIDPMP